MPYNHNLTITHHLMTDSAGKQWGHIEITFSERIHDINTMLYDIESAQLEIEHILQEKINGKIEWLTPDIESIIIDFKVK